MCGGHSLPVWHMLPTGILGVFRGKKVIYFDYFQGFMLPRSTSQDNFELLLLLGECGNIPGSAGPKQAWHMLPTGLGAGQVQITGQF